jgi:hypothetical protein
MPRATEPRIALLIMVLCALMLALAVPVAAETCVSQRDGGRPAIPMLRLEREFQLFTGREYQGVAHDGSRFIFTRSGDGGSFVPSFEEWSEQGMLTNMWNQPNVVTPHGLYDITWCGTYFWGSECWWLRAYDDMTGYQGYWFANNPPHDAGTPVRAMCYAGASRFYTGGWGTHVYRGTWSGGWETTSADEWYQITPEVQNGTSGIAFDQANGALYLSDYIDIKLYQIDPAGGPILGEIPLAGLGWGRPRGCCMAETSEFGSALAILFHDDSGRSAPRLAIFTLDYTPVEDASWGHIKGMYRE